MIIMIDTCNHRVIVTPDQEEVCELCGMVFQNTMAVSANRHRLKEDFKESAIITNLSNFILGTDRGYFNHNNYAKVLGKIKGLALLIMYGRYEEGLLFYSAKTSLTLGSIINLAFWHYRKYTKLQQKYSRYHQVGKGLNIRHFVTLLALKSTFGYDFVDRKLRKLQEEGVDDIYPALKFLIRNWNLMHETREEQERKSFRKFNFFLQLLT